jgi:hypothetical protein
LANFVGWTKLIQIFQLIYFAAHFN